MTSERGYWCPVCEGKRHGDYFAKTVKQLIIHLVETHTR